ncbi:TRADD-N-associated membrane domain-containing protein [Acaryochloris marina]|uniref:TRADD-N-associated membrane domain-containing protein n=1 Tax=Acaryochloris marina TaxID=155978 RepID=UPI001BB00188|nr:hypothetical protein [Acaryochloris marina]QUY46263.1 hypothetical protein I1H34_31665 [Acaryochloris marina S15]
MQRVISVVYISWIFINTPITPAYAQPSQEVIQSPGTKKNRTIRQPILLSQQRFTKSGSNEPEPVYIDLGKSDNFFKIILSLIGSSIAVISLPISKLISKNIDRKSALQESKKINEIAELVKAESKIENVALARTIAEKSLGEDTILEIKEKIQSIEIEVSELNRPIKSAIEGLVRNYHSQALRQSAIQFYFSLIAATFGFGLIIYAGIETLDSRDSGKIINTIPGAVISGVSALFFKQAEETRKRATDLYDRLRSDERQLKAISIASQIESQEVRSLVQAQLVLHLADIETANPLDLSSKIPNLITSKVLKSDEA